MASAGATTNFNFSTLFFSPPSLKLPQMHKICCTPLLHPLFFHVPWHSLKGSLEFNSIDRLSTQFDHLCCRLLFNQAHLGLSIPQFQTLLLAGRPEQLCQMDSFWSCYLKCAELWILTGRRACCDYVAFSSTIYLEFTFYPLLCSVRRQPATEYTSVDSIKRLSKTFVSLTELHPPAAFSYWRLVPTPLLGVSSLQGYWEHSRSLHHASPRSHTLFGHVFPIVCFILSVLIRYLD